MIKMILTLNTRSQFYAIRASIKVGWCFWIALNSSGRYSVLASRNRHFNWFTVHTVASRAKKNLKKGFLCWVTWWFYSHSFPFYLQTNKVCFKIVREVLRDNTNLKSRELEAYTQHSFFCIFFSIPAFFQLELQLLISAQTSFLIGAW